MPSAKSWRYARLGEIAQISGGGTPSREDPSFWDGSIPWLTPGELTSTGSKITSRTEEYLTDTGLRLSGATVMPAGSLLVTTRATLGACTIAGVPMATNQGFKNLQFDRRIADPKFYYHLFKLLGSEMARRASGTTFLEISGSQFGSIQVPVPPLNEQRRIADILDAIDDCIRREENIRSKEETIETATLINQLSSPLFKQSAVRDCIVGRPRNGYSPKEVERWTGVHSLGLGCLTDFGFEPKHLKHVSTEGRSNIARATLADGDVLISRANTRNLVGLVGVYRDIGVQCIYPDLMIRLRPQAAYLPEVLELALHLPESRRTIQAMAQGTSESMVKITGRILADLQIPIPPMEIQERIARLRQEKAAKLKIRDNTIAKLNKLKQGLKDDLLTGRMRV